MFVTPGSRATRRRWSTFAFGTSFDGQGSALAVGTQSTPIAVPFNCRLVQVELLADQSGSVQLDIYKAPYSSYPPTSANSIVASAPPLISSATKSVSTSLLGWKKQVLAGDIFIFYVTSATSITKLTVELAAVRVS